MVSSVSCYFSRTAGAGSQREMRLVPWFPCRSRAIQQCVHTTGALMNKLTLMTRLTLGAAVGALALTSCAGTGDDETAPESTPTQDQAQTDTSSTDAQGNEHAPDGGPPASGIQEATDPTYAVGDHVILNADHMPGMDGAEATISGAFDTTTYSVSYTPTDGG